MRYWASLSPWSALAATLAICRTGIWASTVDVMGSLWPLSSGRAHTTRPRTWGRSVPSARYTSTVQGKPGSTNWTMSPVFVS